MRQLCRGLERAGASGARLACPILTSRGRPLASCWRCSRPWRLSASNSSRTTSPARHRRSPPRTRRPWPPPAAAARLHELGALALAADARLLALETIRHAAAALGALAAMHQQGVIHADLKPGTARRARGATAAAPSSAAAGGGVGGVLAAALGRAVVLIDFSTAMAGRGRCLPRHV